MGLTAYTTDSRLLNLDRVRTGDLLLCSNEPKKGSLLIMTSTRSHWVHVGIAVWSLGNPRRLLIFESTRGKLVQDELTGEIRRGVRLTDIRNVIEEYKVIHVRHLNVERTPHFFHKLHTFMMEWKGKDYVSLLKIPLIPFVCFDDGGVSCSELAARFFKHLGLFDTRPALENYCIENFLPSHFAPGEEFTREMTTLFSNDNSPVIFHKGYFGMDTTLLLCVFALILLSVGLLTMVKNSSLKMSV